MKDVHIVVGVLALVLNLLAFLWGAVAWKRRQPSVWFWRLLRGGQVVVVIQAALGGILLALGYKAPSLHLIYGVLPILISVFAEQFRISSAQMVLDHRGLDNAQAVGNLPPAEQRAIVVQIVRREIGVMTLSALVVVVLIARAAQVAH